MVLQKLDQKGLAYNAVTKVNSLGSTVSFFLFNILGISTSTDGSLGEVMQSVSMRLCFQKLLK
jgi:hypothetical protein